MSLLLWRSGSGLLLNKFRLFLTNLSARDTSAFSFLDKNLGKAQRIFNKFDMCIDIVDICFGIAIGYISLIFSSPELCSG